MEDNNNSQNILPRSNSHQSKKDNMLKNISVLNKKTSTDCNNKVDCICKKLNILIRPAAYEETCFIFDMVENHFGVDASTVLSLQDKVTEVIYPFTDNYDFYRLNYNHVFNIYPVAIVLAHCIDDIVNTINFCRRTGIPIRARGGAHAYQPASLVNFGIILDQQPRNKIVDIDPDNKTVTIQAGALLGPIINQLSKKDLLIPFGTCVTNGLAGLTLGGGIGFATREYGLTLDRLVETKVVLADGSVLDANRDAYSDLFWALRGAGGGNFGVVTDFTFKTVTIPYVTVFTIYYNFDDTKKIFNIWQDWAPYVITELTSELDIFNKFQPVIVTGQLLPIKSKLSDQKILLDLIKPLLKPGIHTNFFIKSMTLKESAEYFGQGSYSRPFFSYNKSDFNFKQLPEAAIDTIIYHMSLLDETQSHHKTEIDALGGNFSKIPSDATAFPSRSAIYWLQYTSLWDTSDQEKINKRWLKNYYADMRKFFPKNRKYVNALDYDVPRNQALKSYYGDNLPDLIEIKHKYDPTNFFKFEQSIPSFEELK